MWVDEQVGECLCVNVIRLYQLCLHLERMLSHSMTPPSPPQFPNTHTHTHQVIPPSLSLSHTHTPSNSSLSLSLTHTHTQHLLPAPRSPLSQVSEDAERTMLVKLKTECGYQFTSKLESMFNDIKISRESMGEFKHAMTAKGLQLEADITVQVLTTGSWPTQAVVKCTLPRELERACDAFQQHYLSAHTNRKLTWQTNMGNADIKVRCFVWGGVGVILGGWMGSEGVKASVPGLVGLCWGCVGVVWGCVGGGCKPTSTHHTVTLQYTQLTFADGRKHELNVSTYQMAILLLFNEVDSLRYTDIAEATQIPAADLKRSLQSLACVKVKSVGA